MRRLATVALFAMAGFVLASDAPPDAVKKERAKLAGTWEMTSFERDENPIDKEMFANIKTTIDAEGKFKVEINGETNVEATTVIDPTKKPKTIDFTFSGGGDLDGKKCAGIYELTDDTFKYCRAAPDKPRPTEFSTKDEQTLVSYKRAKAK